MRTSLRSLFTVRTIGTLAILGIVGGGFLVYVINRPSYDPYLIRSEAIPLETVSVTGKVVPRQTVNLAFETGGKVIAVYPSAGDHVRKGQTIALLDSTAAEADLKRALASLDAEQARLSELKEGGDSDSIVGVSISTLVEKMQTSYTVADDAIRNSVDQVFVDPDSRTPEIIFAFDDHELRKELNEERAEISLRLKRWRSVNLGLTASTYSTELLSEYRTHLSIIQAFVDKVSYAVNRFKPNDSLSQEAIDKYKADISIARIDIRNSFDALTAAEDSVRDSVSEVPYQEAQVKAAEAEVDSIRSALGKFALLSPFSGVVTNVDIEVGEIVRSEASAVTVISDSPLEVELYMPELYISRIREGNSANVTLDAYGSSVMFKAFVTSIDPAETVRDAVSTYRVKLEFESLDDRIRSGMTAQVSVEIPLDRIPAQQIVVPEKAIRNKDETSFVLRLVDGKEVETNVELGAVQDGMREIKSGLSIGDTVAVPK